MAEKKLGIQLQILQSSQKVQNDNFSEFIAELKRFSCSSMIAEKNYCAQKRAIGLCANIFSRILNRRKKIWMKFECKHNQKIEKSFFTSCARRSNTELAVSTLVSYRYSLDTCINLCSGGIISTRNEST